MDESVLNVIKNSFNDILSDNIDDFISAAESMSKQFISLKETKVSSRNFNHWKEEGLIDYSLNEKRVKLSLFEYIWVKSISIMRNFGVSISSIRQTKELLNTDLYRFLIRLREENSDEDFEKILSYYTKGKVKKEDILFVLSNYDKIKKEGILPYANTFFNNAILNCFISREKTDIVVFEDGDTFLLLESTYGYLKETKGAEIVLGLEKVLAKPHLKINLNYLINEFLNEKERADYIVNKHIFSDSELLLINILKRESTFKVEAEKNKKSNDYKITVTQRNQHVDEENTRIIKEILGLGKYDTITLKADGDKLFAKRKQSK